VDKGTFFKADDGSGACLGPDGAPVLLLPPPKTGPALDGVIVE
jgi:hypothetical protein